MLNTARRRGPIHRGGQGGLSIVEMLVGIAVGLIVVAAASMTVATQLSDNRRLLMEMQLQQDLRAATDTISRELRRAGFSILSGSQVPVAGLKVTDQRNPRSVLTPGSGSSSKIEYEYDRVALETANRYGFCQGAACAFSSPGMVRSKLGPGIPGFPTTEPWHELTDDKAVNVTSLTITPVTSTPVKMACPTLCPVTNDTACWPTIAVREVIVTISGQSVVDPSVQRTLSSRIRLRNDVVNLSIPGTGAAGALVACP